MTRAGAPLAGWGAFLLAALAASAAGAGAELGFAAAAIAVLGLPHGAGDLAVVPRARRAPFLLAYGVVVAGVATLWLAAPMPALCLLLACSAAHFALDEPAPGGKARAWAIGVCLIAAPAAIHRDGVAALFADITGDAPAAPLLARLLAAIAVPALAAAVAAVLRNRHRTPAHRTGTLLVLAATVLLPPLVGFATGFVLLHARGQTDRRRRNLGCATTAAYLRRVAPVLAGAAAVLAAVAAVFARHPHGGVVTLFAAIAALAMPHMLVTPLALRAGRAGRRAWPAAAAGLA